MLYYIILTKDMALHYCTSLTIFLYTSFNEDLLKKVNGKWLLVKG